MVEELGEADSAAAAAAATTTEAAMEPDFFILKCGRKVGEEEKKAVWMKQR